MPINVTTTIPEVQTVPTRAPSKVRTSHIYVLSFPLVIKNYI
jgi:hypothetical protein